MNTRLVQKTGPYSSSLLRRGALGKLADGRTKLGRFIRCFEAELVEHCGGKPTVTQKILIDRIVRMRVRIDMLEEKMTAGTFTDYDGKVYGGLLNGLRLTARDLGLEAPAPPAEKRTLRDLFPSQTADVA
jgi:hypothetical protein